MSMDIWMRENPLTYVWLGSYMIALLVFVVEVIVVVQGRKSVLRQIRLMRDNDGDEV
jgi:heme exporter protein D